MNTSPGLWMMSTFSRYAPYLEKRSIFCNPSFVLQKTASEESKQNEVKDASKETAPKAFPDGVHLALIEFGGISRKKNRQSSEVNKNRDLSVISSWPLNAWTVLTPMSDSSAIDPALPTLPSSFRVVDVIF